MSDDIEWEDPPPTARISGSGTKPGRYAAIAAACKDNPNRWAVLPFDGERTPDSAAGTANNVRLGRVKGFELEPGTGKFDVAIDGGKLWVRFVPPKPGARTPEGPQEDDEEPGERTAAPAARVRAWAREKGIEVPAAGRLPHELTERYLADTGGLPPGSRHIAAVPRQ